MNTKLVKKLIPLVILLATFASMSSCNRGYGCPQWSVDQVVKAVDNVTTIIVKE